MSVPKSVTKISRDGNVTFKSNVNAVEYTLRELTRGALRDVGKFVAKQYKVNVYKKLHKRTGNITKNISYWARSRDCDLQVGLGKKNKKNTEDGFYSRFYETGTSRTPKLSILRNTVYDNISQIIEIESKYLSELNKDKPNLSGLSEQDYEE